MKTAFALAAIALLCACRSSTADDARYGSTSPTTPSTGIEEAATGREAESQTGALSLVDREFVAEAVEVGLFEVESSRIALEKKISERVRDFARTMIEDHGETNQQLADLAATKRAAAPSEPGREQRADLDELRQLEGAEFERRYFEMQIRAHDEAIELFERASNACDDPDLRAFATDALATLREHRTHLDLPPR